MEVENLDIKKQFYKTLNERQRRLYTGQLALDMGHGSIKVICSDFNIWKPASKPIIIKLWKV